MTMKQLKSLYRNHYNNYTNSFREFVRKCYKNSDMRIFSRYEEDLTPKMKKILGLK